MSVFENIKYELRKSGIIVWIIIINLAIFLPLNIISNFYPDSVEWLAFPLDFDKFIHKPWTIITSMFTHVDLGHIFYNMFWFYMMGRIFTVVTNFHHPSKILFIYIVGGLSGALLLAATGLVIPGVHGKIAFGASAAVMAIILVAGVYSPNYEVVFFLIGEIKLKWVVAFLFVAGTVIDLTDNTGGKIAHLGGSIFGAVYALQLRNGHDMSAWFTNLFTQKKSRTKLKVVHHKRAARDDQYNAMRRDDEKTLNDLLDKINKSGYESLSKSEKETLHFLSKKK